MFQHLYPCNGTFWIFSSNLKCWIPFFSNMSWVYSCCFFFIKIIFFFNPLQQQLLLIHTRPFKFIHQSISKEHNIVSVNNSCKCTHADRLCWLAWNNYYLINTNFRSPSAVFVVFILRSKWVLSHQGV